MLIREMCDSCRGPLRDVFSMGSMPLANSLLKANDLASPGEAYPLVVAECTACSLVQLRYVVEPEVMYSDYRFFTGASAPNTALFRSLAKSIKRRVRGGLAIEIGSNDGTLLESLEAEGFDVVGVDPAKAHCEIARKRLVRGTAINAYWSESVAAELTGRADVVVACNVLGHSDNLNDFISGVSRALKPNGVFVVEVQYLRSLLEEAGFEMMYHEHVSYFDEWSLGALLARHGFAVEGCEVIDAQCGTLRMWASKTAASVLIEPCKHDWQKFRSDLESRRESVMSRIEDAISNRRSVCFYGAPAKATQLANYWKLGTDTIEFATDTTPAKQGLWIPGALIPIVPRHNLTPDYTAIVAAWNFYRQIVDREAEFLAAGGELICPTLKGEPCITPRP
ncbi:MAG: methyltransferase family protein [Schlesneria sp.]|nr:methyltransferase family protein [Schlesneria sp.]